MVERLLQAGARLDAMDQGKAPLHWAAHWGSEPLVRLLLQYKADRFQVGDGDMLPATYARMRKAPKVEQLLAPSAGAAWRRHFQGLCLSVLQGCALMLVMFTLVGMMYRALGETPKVHNIDWPPLYAQLFVATLVVRAVLNGSWGGFGARLRAGLGTILGWVVGLLGPLALCALALVVTGVAHDSFDSRTWLTRLGQLYWLVAVAALVVTVMTLQFGSRMRRGGQSYETYLRAVSPGRKVGGGMPWLALCIGAVLFAGVLLPLPGLLASGDEPPSARSRQREREQEIAPRLARATLGTDLWVAGPQGQRCQVPKGTPLTDLELVMSTKDSVRLWNATVAKPLARCGSWLASHPIHVAEQFLRNTVAADAPAKPGRGG